MLIFTFKTFFFSWAAKINTKFCLKSTLVSWLNLELFYANDGIVFSFTISKILLVNTKSINKKKKHAKKEKQRKSIFRWSYRENGNYFWIMFIPVKPALNFTYKLQFT